MRHGEIEDEVDEDAIIGKQREKEKRGLSNPTQSKQEIDYAAEKLKLNQQCQWEKGLRYDFKLNHQNDRSRS